MVVKEEFRSAPGEGDRAGQAECIFLLSLLFVFSRVCGGRGEGERGPRLGRRENLGC